jgi:hypothetical protein
VLHIMDFTTAGQSEGVALAIHRPVREAALLTLDGKREALSPQKERMGFEFHLPAFSTYAAVEYYT